MLSVQAGWPKLMAPTLLAFESTCIHTWTCPHMVHEIYTHMHTQIKVNLKRKTSMIVQSCNLSGDGKVETIRPRDWKCKQQFSETLTPKVR